ncbi:class II aldolase|nr:class II aldolase [Candidatus Pantoea persica]
MKKWCNEDGHLLATPTGSCLGELQAERLSKVTLAGEWLSGDKPLKRWRFTAIST